MDLPVTLRIEAKDEYPDPADPGGALPGYEPGAAEVVARLGDRLADETKHDEQIGWRVNAITPALSGAGDINLPDEWRRRLQAQPMWVRELVRVLESRIGTAEAETAALRAQFGDLAGDPTDTELVSAEGSDVPNRPLGDGAVIEFLGTFTATTDLGQVPPQFRDGRDGVVIYHGAGSAGMEIVTVDADVVIIRERP